MQGRITKQISNLYTVDINGKYIECSARGKFRNMKISPVVGDIVEVDLDNSTIEEIKERRNKLERPVVANVDVALIVTSLRKPDLSLSLLDKLITIVSSKNIEPVICLTKWDLLEKNAKRDLKPIIKYYKKIGIEVLDNRHIGKIKRKLKGKIVVLTGQTGAGKSSLLNRLDKSLNLETNPISEALNRGVHTTRHTELYKIGKIYFVDTPGFSALDLSDITVDELKNSFQEFKKYNCEFKNCKHGFEKKCGVREAYLKGEIRKSRYENYQRFLKEINESSSKLYK